MDKNSIKSQNFLLIVQTTLLASCSYRSSDLELRKKYIDRIVPHQVQFYMGDAIRVSTKIPDDKCSVDAADEFIKCYLSIDKNPECPRWMASTDYEHDGSW